MSNIRGTADFGFPFWGPEDYGVPVGNASAQTPTSRPVVCNSGASSSHLPEDQIMKDLLKWEGDVHYLYLDKKGLVTIGIGNLLKTAQAAEALPFIDRKSGAPATRAQIDAAFEKISHQQRSLGAAAYASLTDICLSKEAVHDLAAERLQNEFLPGLRRKFPAFDSFPVPAQRALTDMVYSMGVGRLGAFPKLSAACKSGDWQTAAQECHRQDCRVQRNDWTRDLFLQAAAASPPCFQSRPQVGT